VNVINVWSSLLENVEEFNSLSIFRNSIDKVDFSILLRCFRFLCVFLCYMMLCVLLYALSSVTDVTV